MKDNNNNHKYEEIDDLEEVVERLVPATNSAEALDTHLAEEVEIADQSLHLLFKEETIVTDEAIDSLFDEGRENLKNDLKDEVQKALSRPEMSKASLFRMRMSEPSESALKEGIAQKKTVEEIWDEPIDESDVEQNKKSIWIMCLFIALASTAGGWALWQSTNDERGNEELLLAQEKETKIRAESRKILEGQVREVSELMDRYLSSITVDQKLENIYQSESVREEVEAYYESNENLHSLPNYSVGSIFPIKIDNEEIWEVHVMGDEANIKPKRYYVRTDLDGSQKIDWKADVVFQNNSIEQFKKTRSRKSVGFRFEVRPMTEMPTYNWGFTDTEYDVYRLTIPNKDCVFWGYARKNSLEHKRLIQNLVEDSKDQMSGKKLNHQYILNVRFMEDSPSENDQYIVITGVVSRKWITLAR